MTALTAKPGSEDDTENLSCSMNQTLRRLLTYLTRYRFRLFLSVLFMIGFSVAMGILPALMGLATDVIAGKGSPDDLTRILLFFMIDATALWVCGHLAQHLLSLISQEALFTLRTELFTHIQSLSLSFFDRQPIGELMSRVSNDTDVIDQFFSNGIQQVLQSVTTIIVLTLVMLIINPVLTLLVYLAVFGMLAISSTIARISGPAFEHMQEGLGELNGFAEERLAGQKVTIAYNQQESTSKGFTKLSQQVAWTGGRAQFVALTSMPAATIMSNLQMILLLVVGGAMVMEGDIQLGELVAFLGLSSCISSPLSQIFSEYALIINASAGASRVFRILDEQPVVADLPDAVTMPAIKGDVIFDAVDFSYVPGRTVLKNNTFHALPGNIFGLCGPTGAGKSTIINILTRYYDIQSGSITIDGVRIDEVVQDSLRIQIAQVLQEPFLFSSTVLDNLRYARSDATDEECIAAAKQAGAYEFIMAQPHGFETYLNDGGSNLSQGQRQMLTIARAMVSEPHLLILDEATSNVDTRTEKLIQSGLLNLQQGKTSFIIAHRLSTIRHADCILVINQGEIVERGTHDDLMAAKGFYYSLYVSQFRGKLSAITGFV
ncbi:MAG: ABC transporter ATP-binding protein/permease [Methanospirillum sp.]|uniref:ABC transporter ATP-binding protein n=1 Tax=Methanospirillum sp. TaxID=45200 RepID=UPI00236C85BB|nr:ABC transporter ATP-binding protein [Methanospirillum sp.]MDD1730404.1 ABC transporter ATP-binding protein/permease [Methanospirillum sp.]